MHKKDEERLSNLPKTVHSRFRLRNPYFTCSTLGHSTSLNLSSLHRLWVRFTSWMPRDDLPVSFLPKKGCFAHLMWLLLSWPEWRRGWWDGSNFSLSFSPHVSCLLHSGTLPAPKADLETCWMGPLESEMTPSTWLCHFRRMCML